MTALYFRQKPDCNIFYLFFPTAFSLVFHHYGVWICTFITAVKGFYKYWSTAEVATIAVAVEMIYFPALCLALTRENILSAQGCRIQQRKSEAETNCTMLIERAELKLRWHVYLNFSSLESSGQVSVAGWGYASSMNNVRDEKTCRPQFLQKKNILSAHPHRCLLGVLFSCCFMQETASQMQPVLSSYNPGPNFSDLVTQ